MIVNYTPHAVKVIAPNGVETVFEPSGKVARVATYTTLQECIEGYPMIPIYNTYFGETVGIPPIEQGIVYIVSTMVRQALPNRADFYSPAELIRDEQGRVVGCNGLTR